MTTLPVVALAGAGTIGAAWAVVFARAGCRVRAWDAAPDALASLPARIAEILGALDGTSLAGQPGAAARVTVHTTLAEAVDGADWIQEQVAEDLAVKRDVLRAIEAVARPDAILASSTSGLAPAALADGLGQPGRFVIVHPLTPPFLLPVTEIVTHPGTSEATLAEAWRVMEAVGQKPIRIHGETGGFAMNRLQAALLNEMIALVRDGVVSAPDADAILTHGFGLRWAVIGPLAGVDLNAPEGIRQYMERYGFILDGVTRDRGAAPALTPAAIAALHDGMRAEVPIEALPARRQRRDRAIAQLRDALDGVETP